MKIFAKQMLKSRIFLGHYQEKRYVNKLKAYKDLVVMNKQEKILCDNIGTVQSSIHSFYENDANIWFGFTHPETIGAPAAYCIWTTLISENKDSTIAFGDYWFQIKTVKFSNVEIEIQLKVLRPVNTTASISQSFECDPVNFVNYIQENLTNVDWPNLFHSWRNAINENTFRFFSEQVTLDNIKNSFRIVGVLMVLIITAIMRLVLDLGEFTLKLIRELSKLIEVATPIIIVLINTLGKIVGGLFILLSMIWRDAFGGRNNQNQNYQNRDSAFSRNTFSNTRNRNSLSLQPRNYRMLQPASGTNPIK